MGSTCDRLSYERWLYAYRTASGTGRHAENIRLKALIYAPETEKKPHGPALRLVVDNTHR